MRQKTTIFYVFLAILAIISSCKKENFVPEAIEPHGYDVSHLNGTYLIDYSMFKYSGGFHNLDKDEVIRISSDLDSIYVGDYMSFEVESADQLEFTDTIGDFGYGISFSEDYQSLSGGWSRLEGTPVTMVEINGNRSSLPESSIPSDFNLSFSGEYEFSIKEINTEESIDTNYVDTLSVAWGEQSLIIEHNGYALDQFHSTFQEAVPLPLGQQTLHVWFRGDSLYYRSYMLDTSTDPFWQTVEVEYAGRKL